MRKKVELSAGWNEGGPCEKRHPEAASGDARDRNKSDSEKESPTKKSERNFLNVSCLREARIKQSGKLSLL